MSEEATADHCGRASLALITGINVKHKISCDNLRDLTIRGCYLAHNTHKPYCMC